MYFLSISNTITVSDLLLFLAPFNGVFDLKVHDEAWVVGNLGLIQRYIDIFRVKVCYQLNFHYDLNILKVSQSLIKKKTLTNIQPIIMMESTILWSLLFVNRILALTAFSIWQRHLTDSIIKLLIQSRTLLIWLVISLTWVEIISWRKWSQNSWPFSGSYRPWSKKWQKICTNHY